DLQPILEPATPPYEGVEVRCTKAQDHGLELALDNKLIELSKDAIHHGKKVNLDLEIANVNRTVGTMLSHNVVKVWGERGLP
ncbi:MAG: glutamate synthase, partial [Gammaproteobacteria bacterium]|nr:glutamate synthase [Gammaproteobacteria bacterium]NIT93551.1 glutamate synthase [Gammaproteobacteria bacterium]